MTDPDPERSPDQGELVVVTGMTGAGRSTAYATGARATGGPQTARASSNPDEYSGSRKPKASPTSTQRSCGLSRCR